MTPLTLPRELVLASAGSGKTFRISSRIIGLFAAGVEIEQVFASTFTRKAAGEILDRVLARLARAALDPGEAESLSAASAFDSASPPPTDSAYWGELLRTVAARLHRANVGTLDAFFVRAAGAFRHELGLPPTWRIADPATAARFQSRALLELLRAADAAEVLELLRLVSHGEARRSVHEFLAARMALLLEVEESLDPDSDDPWGVFGAGGDPGPPTFGERLAVLEMLRRLPVPTTKAGTPRRNWANALSGAADALEAGDWEAVAMSPLCGKVAAGESRYDGVEIDGHTRSVFEEVVDLARRGIRPRLSAQIGAIGRLAAMYREVYRDLQRREGVYGFTDMTRLIGGPDPLGSRSDLFYRLDARTRHVLLDEFQDTSLPQWEALAPIVDEALSDADRAAVIVADPKQSIYGWRGAEPLIVRAVGDRYSLAGENLATSWRSSQVVLDFVNRVFTGIDRNPRIAQDAAYARTASDWSRDFQPHEAQRALPGHVRIEVGPPDEGRNSHRPRHFRWAAERVAALREESPELTIGVLTRANRTVARLFVELRTLGVAVSQEGGNPLTDAAACEAVLALFRLADHPGDRVARYHVASSPVGPLFDYTGWESDGAAFALSARIRRHLLEEGYGRTCARLARDLAPYCDAREARRLGQLAELGHRHDVGATLRPGDFVRLAESERIEDATTARVRVMTVHQAKGLEFDIVVLPELDTPVFGRGAGAPVLPYRADPAGRTTAVYPAAPKEIRRLFPEMERAHQQARDRGFRDALSTLYVALTRPRHALHVLIAPDGENGPGTSHTLARIVREAFRPPDAPLQTAVEGTVLLEEGDPDWCRHIPRLRPGSESHVPAHRGGSVRVDVSSGRRRSGRGPAPSHGSAPRIRFTEILRLENEHAMRRGTLAHAFFERIRWLEEGVPPEAELRAIARALAPNIDSSGVQSLIASFHASLDAPQIRAIMSRASYPAGAIVETELPFLRRAAGSNVEGKIDRVVLGVESGRYVSAEVIDFKTDRVGRDLTRAARLAESYASQLGSYRDAVSAIYRIPRDRCAAKLVFLDGGHVLRIDPPETPDPLLAARP